MHLHEIFDLTLTKVNVTWSIVLYIMWPMYLQSLKLLGPMVKEMHYQDKTLFDLEVWPWPQSQGHKKCCPVHSTLCNLCTSKFWCCYIPWLGRWYIYKKIYYLTLTLGSRSRKMLPSTLDIMWPMHKQSLILLPPTVKEKMHLQENTFFDLDPKVTRNVARCHLHHVTYAATEFEVTTSKALGGEAFIRKFNIWPWPWGQGHTKVKVTQNVAQYPLHHVTYSSTKVEVATSQCFGGNAFTRKFNIWPWGQGHTNYCPVPSASYDPFSYNAWSCYV